MTEKVDKRIWLKGENNYPKSVIKNKECPECHVKAILCGGCGLCRVCCDIGQTLAYLQEKEKEDK